MAECVQQQLVSICDQFDATWNCTGYQNHTVYRILNEQPVNYTSCLDVLATPSELSYFPQLTAEQGGFISASIIGIWAIGFAWRALKRAM